MEKALHHFINGNQKLCVPTKSKPRRPLLSLNALPPSSAAAATVISTSHSKLSYWESINSSIDAHLRASIQVRKPLSVFEPMHHLTLAAPRTAAPALCIAACELVGGCRGQAMDAAAAFHLVHASCSLHEDLRDEEHAGNASPLDFKSNIKLLTGDGILPFALELIARSSGVESNKSESESERILRVVVEITRAAGMQGLVKGHYNQLQWRQLIDHLGPNRSNEFWMDHVCGKKDGGWHASAAACGAILGGGTEVEVEKLRKFGFFAGMIRGISAKYGGGDGERDQQDEDSMELVEQMREIALKELRDFNGESVAEIYSICESKFVISPGSIIKQ